VYPGDPTGVKNLLAWVRRQGAAAGSGSTVPEVGGRMLRLLLQQQLGVGFTWPKGRQVAAIFCEYTHLQKALNTFNFYIKCIT
jgi:hypothetical protein